MSGGTWHDTRGYPPRPFPYRDPSASGNKTNNSSSNHQGPTSPSHAELASIPSNASSVYVVDGSERLKHANGSNLAGKQKSQSSSTCTAVKVVLVVAFWILLAALICGIVYFIMTLIDDTDKAKETDDQEFQMFSGTFTFPEFEFNAALDDQSTDEYQRLSKDVTASIDALYLESSVSNTYIGSEVIGFSEGSVIVHYVLNFREPSSMVDDQTIPSTENVMEILENAAVNEVGEIFSEIDPGSIVIEEDYIPTTMRQTTVASTTAARTTTTLHMSTTPDTTQAVGSTTTDLIPTTARQTTAAKTTAARTTAAKTTAVRQTTAAKTTVARTTAAKTTAARTTAARTTAARTTVAKTTLQVSTTPEHPPIAPTTQSMPTQPVSTGCGIGGIERAQRIVNGHTTYPGKWPWLVSLQFINFHLCGAAIISDFWILTAAHCLYDIDTSRLRLYINSTTLSHDDGYLVYIEEFFMHPDYDDATTDYDIALLRLRNRLVFTDTVAPICLETFARDDLDLDECVIAGWGLTEEDGEKSLELLDANVPVVTHSVCAAYYVYGITERMMCAGFAEGGTDSCSGDSGGPLMCPSGDGIWQVAGVTSWGVGCARPERPGVYADVSTLSTYVYSVMDNYGPPGPVTYDPPPE